MSTNAVVIGLGSNLQNPKLQLRRALSELRAEKDIKIENVSPLYESLAQMPADAPADWNKNFLNAAVKVTYQKSPQDLLALLKGIEKKLGRHNSETWAPRIIDLDILYWENVVVKDSNLQIPHPHLTQRPFALLPLLDVLPSAKVEKPTWAAGWAGSAPFETKKSTTHFWPKLVGIVNLTPDSFSDGSKDLNFQKIEQLLQAGAEVLDFGAESTRPNAAPVSAADEWARLKAGLEQLKSLNINTKISIDSYKPEVVEKCIEYFKIDYLNDVTGFSHPQMRKLLQMSKCKGFVMHSLDVPAVIANTLSDEKSPMILLTEWWKQKCRELVEEGIDQSQLIFDPGISFGKTKTQSLFILKHLEQLNEIKSDIMIGHSRKSYQTLFSDRPAPERDLETALVTSNLNLGYVQYLRVHDIQSQKTALSFSR